MTTTITQINRVISTSGFMHSNSYTGSNRTGLTANPHGYSLSKNYKNEIVVEYLSNSNNRMAEIEWLEIRNGHLAKITQLLVANGFGVQNTGKELVVAA